MQEIGFGVPSRMLESVKALLQLYCLKKQQQRSSPLNYYILIIIKEFYILSYLLFSLQCTGGFLDMYKKAEQCIYISLGHLPREFLFHCGLWKTKCSRTVTLSLCVVCV